jgi:hypothetical protein
MEKFLLEFPSSEMSLLFFDLIPCNPKKIKCKMCGNITSRQNRKRHLSWFHPVDKLEHFLKINNYTDEYLKSNITNTIFSF